MSSFPFHVVDEAAFLDRQERMRAAIEGGTLDPSEMSRLLAQVDPLPWVVGRTYVIEVMAGRPGPDRHVHGIDDAGYEHALDLPTMERAERQVMVVRPLGRVAGYPGWWHVSPMLFALSSGDAALLHEVDILRAEEVAP